MFRSPPEPCRPPGWARGAHRQTILGAIVPPREPRLSQESGYRALRIPLRDGGALSAWHQRGDSGVLVVLLHGLGGSTEASYMRSAAEGCRAAGHSVLAVNHRGSGGEGERTTRPYMAGNTRDLEDLLLWARLCHPDSAVTFVGFSISGNTLLRWLGDGALDGDHPEAAIACNPPIDLDDTSRHLKRWPQHGYDLWILRATRRWIPHLRGEDGAHYSVPALSSLREFDRRYIAPLWGFPDRDSYYRAASCAPYLARIQVPTVILTAADDPISLASRIEQEQLSDAIHLHVEKHGGHLGYLSKGERGLERWLPAALVHYLEAVRVPSRRTRLEPDPCVP